MNKHSNKLNITDSKLFKEVSEVIGKVAALEELTKAYREYVPTSDYRLFNWQKDLMGAFCWYKTPQGKEFWVSIYIKAKDFKLQKKGHLI